MGPLTPSDGYQQRHDPAPRPTMIARAVISFVGRTLRRHGAAVAAGAIGLLAFIRIAGLRPLNPLWAGWLTAGDGLGHLMGWLLYRIEPWRLPLGSMRGMLYPYG